MGVALAVAASFCVLSVCVFFIQKKGAEKKRLARIADQEAAKKKADEQLASKEAEEAQRVREEAQQNLQRVGSHAEMLGNRNQTVISGKGTSFCNIKPTPRLICCARST